MKIEWTAQDSIDAVVDGWDVFHVDGQYHDIQRHDESEQFKEDTDAIAHVYWKATAGSVLHRKALLFVLRENNTCPDSVMSLKIKGR